MDIISFNEASTANGRIESFIENPDSTSGVVTVPKVIASGETITIPTGRVAVLPNVQVDGTLNIEGDVFIPSGATFSKVVETEGNQTIDGVKTFSTSPIVPTPTTGAQAVNKDYVDLKDAQNVKLSGNQTIAGVKTFTDRPFFLSPSIGTSGAVGLFDAPGNPDSVYIQALNNERNVQYGFLKFNKDGTIKPSGNLVGNITGNAETVTNGVYTTNFTGTNQSKSANGYQKLPGGLIMQWGRTTTNIAPAATLNITFPVAFPVECFYSDMAIVSASPSNGLYVPYVVATSLSNLAITNNDADSTITQIRWFAIGF